MKSLNTTKENILNTPAIECIFDLMYESELAKINNRLIEISK